MSGSLYPERLLGALSVVIGGTSLVAFGAFLFFGPLPFFVFSRTTAEALVVDMVLSLLFFVQHSGMVRHTFQRRLARIAPEHTHAALYSVASGATLFVVILCWQPTEGALYLVDPPSRWLLQLLFCFAGLGMLWGVRALGSFDAFGVEPLRRRDTGSVQEEMTLVIKGPYRWVRHPLYSLILVMIWTCPEMTFDRCLFNFVWTIWIVVGSILEERDLVAGFGDAYVRYQQQVPMLLPYRTPYRLPEGHAG